MDWLDLLAVQETLKTLLQHHSSTASILRCSAFFIVQLSYPYMTTGKTIALSRWTFVGKVMSLLFNMSGMTIAFLPRSKCLNFMAAVTICSDFGAQENKDHGIWSRHFMANRWGNRGNSDRLFWGAPKSLQMVTAAMKLKDTCSSKEML